MQCVTFGNSSWSTLQIDVQREIVIMGILEEEMWASVMQLVKYLVEQK